MGSSEENGRRGGENERGRGGEENKSRVVRE